MRRMLFALAFGLIPSAIACARPFAQQVAQQATQPDPFAGVSAAQPAQPSTSQNDSASWLRRFFHDNFGFRKEVMLQAGATESGDAAGRESLGFEALKKFSTETSTVASFDVQARLVRRDGYVAVSNDMEGMNRRGWALEYHNLYVDLYNVFNPFLSEQQKSGNVGRFNFRAGHFYVPFGLNLQTDTHGTLLQLSNERNFGFERDWYTGFWGSINQHVNYDAYYLAGSGYDLKFKGQSGLGALRLSLANRYSSRYGLEGGVSILGGQRLSESNAVIDTQRAGVDGRYKHVVPAGLLTFTSEVSGGRDLPNRVFTQLHQVDYLRASRRWGVATQFRRFAQDGLGADASMTGEFSWYFRNDVGGSNAQWIKLNVGRVLQQQHPGPSTIVAVQYYFYR